MSFPSNPSASRFFRGGLRPLGFCIDKAIAPVLKQRGFAESRLLTDWALIIGEQLASQTCVERIRFPKQGHIDGVLYVKVYHSGLVTELVYMEPILIEKIATYFGYRAVEKIKWMLHPGYNKKQQKTFKQAPIASDVAQQKIRIMLDNIDDDGVKTSLNKLGMHVLGSLGQ
jgi:hypothetical protein